MKTLGGILIALILAIQAPLWLGKGGWLRVWEVDRQLEAQRARNAQLEARNAALAAETRDLKQGLDAIEERARYELGMIRHDEVFFQFVEPRKAASDPVSQPANLPAER
jgi:cell division protein FtsB